jgi:thiamine biosynthesis lipoprotein ApbE
VLSASVICSSCADAEALTKVPFIIEIDAALKLIEQAGAECMVVDHEYKVHKTKGWDKFR